MIYRITNDGHKHAHLVKNREELMALRNSKENLENLAKARNGDAGAKAHLVQFAYNLGHVDGALAGCKSIGSFFFHDIDCYNKSEELRVKSEESDYPPSPTGEGRGEADLKEQILSKKDEIGLMMLERSASGGWHIVAKRVPGTTILENQVRIATILQIEMDTSTKDLQRVVFSTSGSPDDLIYLDDELFTEPMTPEECVQEYNRLKVRVMQRKENVPAGAKKANKHYRPWQGSEELRVKSEEGLARRPEGESQFAAAVDNSQLAQDATSTLNSQFPAEYHGIPFSDILKKYWEINNKGFEPTEGDRDTLTFQLACDLRHICGKNFEWLDQVIPCYDNFPLEEKRQKIRNALNSDLESFPARLRNVLNALSPQKQDNNSQFSILNSQSIKERMDDWGSQIEELSEHFPIIKDICKGLKKNQYPAALFVGGGLLMTLMTRCTYRFYHRPEERRRLNNSTLIIGDPASGKSFATRLYKLLAEPIVKADEEGKKAINAYRELIKSKGANKDKPQKPKVVVRVHPARTSNAQFIQDMVNAVENVDGEDMQLHMLTFDTELDNTVAVQKGGSWIDKMTMELKAFHNEEDGQAYSNADSVMQDFNVFWNYIYTGTPSALKKKVNSQNFGTGLATRLTCIPLPKTNFKMMSRESTVDYESDQRLKDWAYKLDRMKGELSLQKIVDELYEWTARRMADAEENQSEADEMLLKRCAYHGLNFSAPFIVMRHWDKIQQDGAYWCGEFETDAVDWKLAELIVNIQYACQRHFFGKLAENYFIEENNEANVNFRRHQKTFEGFERLPEEFTAEDVQRCFRLSNYQSARSRVKRLLADHLIEKIKEIKDGQVYKAIYRKTGTQML